MNQQISEGQAVYGSDGTELGKVKEVQGGYLKVDVPMAPDYWLRLDDLTSSGPAGGLLVRDGAEQYNQPGDDLEMHGSTLKTRDGDMSTDALTHQHTDDDRRTTRDQIEPGGEAHTLELREEQLRVAKEQEQAGAVRLGKRVEEHTEQVDVPLREERVVIERHPGNGQAAGAITDTDEAIEVPAMRERAVVDKEAVVREEVAARTEAVEHTERVQDTVRREELVVDGDGDTITDGETINAPSMPEYEREQPRRG
jgi:uncharacterized protein (TIGR02271 family)